MVNQESKRAILMQNITDASGQIKRWEDALTTLERKDARRYAEDMLWYNEMLLKDSTKALVEMATKE